MTVQASQYDALKKRVNSKLEAFHKYFRLLGVFIHNFSACHALLYNWFIPVFNAYSYLICRKQFCKLCKSKCKNVNVNW